MHWYKDRDFWKRAAIAFWISLASMWLIYEVLDYFKLPLPWSHQRKKLRVEVGHFLEVAARQTNNYETLARTLIEDLGNTIMGLGDANQGINYIKQGIEVAKAHDLRFLTARGYRNLANCYSYKGQSARARAALADASAATQNISSPQERLEAEGAIAYAEPKILAHRRRLPGRHRAPRPRGADLLRPRQPVPRDHEYE